MDDANKSRRKVRPAGAFALAAAYTLASVVVLFVFIVRPGLTEHPRADFPEQIAGTAHRPFVYRALVPATIRLAVAFVPARVESFLSDRLGDRRMVRMLGWRQEYLAEYAIGLVVLLAYLVAFAFVLRALTMSFYALPPVLCNLGPVIGLLVLPFSFSYYSYVYDPGTLFTFSLCLLTLVKGRFAWFVAAFVLAAVNKETSILIVPLYGVNARLGGRKTPWFRLVGLFVAWISIRAALAAVYADNPGTILERHFGHTVWLFTTFPIRMFLSLAVVLIIAAFVGHRWREKPKLLRLGLAVTLAPLVLAALFFGYLDELRAFHEAFPLLYLLALPSIYDLLGEPPKWR